MKKLNYVLFFAVGLFFAGTQFSVAQVEEEKEETVTKTESVEVKKVVAADTDKETMTTTISKTETEIDKKSEMPAKVNGEGTREDLEDDDLEDDGDDM